MSLKQKRETPGEQATAASGRPVRSMTGFARIAGEVLSTTSASPNGCPASWTLSIKSVNHRFLDIQLRMPANLDSLEMNLRRILKENIARGHLELTLNYEAPTVNETAGYDRELITRYLTAFRDARHRRQWPLPRQPAPGSHGCT
jgi:uncharacterized protein (TIGR00255 family)